MKRGDLQLFAPKKGQGSSTKGRDSIGKPLGIKRRDGQEVTAGSRRGRKRGTKYHPGDNVGRGRDDTLFALKPGKVRFVTKAGRKFVAIENVIA
jgi:large subunit ribosomal protein L27